MVFLEVMYWDCEASRSACAFIIRSMLADQPYSPVTKTQGESARQLKTTTFSTLSPKTCFIKGLLFVFVVGKVKSFLGGGEKLLSVKFLQLLNSVFINGVNHVQDFVSLLLELLKEGRSLDDLVGFSGDVVNTGLVVVHAADVVLEGGHFLSRLGGLVSQQLGNLSTVGGIFVNSEL